MVNTRSKGDKIFDLLNYTFFTLLSFTMLFPFWNEICISFSEPLEVMKGGFFLTTRGFTLETYQSVVGNMNVWNAYKNSIFITVMHTFLGVFFTALTSYPLSKKKLRGGKTATKFILFTMLFNGGMIPTYLVVREVGLINSLWALVIPGLMNAYNIMIMKNFFQAIPEELEESALIDGANPIHIFFRIILPLSKPVLATVALWIAVGTWNNFFGSLIYLNERVKFTLPIFLREILQGQQQASDLNEIRKISLDTLKSATIILTVLPIISTYPFLQKYFVKGVLIGSVKG